MYEFENDLISNGYLLIAGCDEVGRGPLAGPLVAAAVILDTKVVIPGLNDSKKLSEKKRNLLDKEIREKAVAFSIVYISESQVDKINVYQSSKKAMTEAIQSLEIQPDYVLSDAMPLNDLGIPFLSIIKGDTLSASIAAASIIAKVERDQYMVELGRKYPEYGFEKHKGYPTKQHLAALEKYGVLPVHRKSYKPVKDKLSRQLNLNI